MAINLSYVKTKNTLQVAAHKTDLLGAIVAKVEEIDNHTKLKFDTELCVFICRCIENALECKKKKIDKKTLAFEVYDKLFEMSSDDRAIISTLIDFLCNNKLIKKIPTLYKWGRLTSDFFTRHL